MLGVGEADFLLHAKAITGLSGLEPTHVCTQTVQLPSLRPGKCVQLSAWSRPGRGNANQAGWEASFNQGSCPPARPCCHQVPALSLRVGGGALCSGCKDSGTWAWWSPWGGAGDSWPIWAPLAWHGHEARTGGIWQCSADADGGRGWGQHGWVGREGAGGRERGLRREREDKERMEGDGGGMGDKEVERWREIQREGGKEGEREEKDREGLGGGVS